MIVYHSGGVGGDMRPEKHVPNLNVMLTFYDIKKDRASQKQRFKTIVKMKRKGNKQ